jgi:superfamily I DNA/RNA helicase
MAAELARMAAELARIDAETALVTGLDLDAAVGADLRALGLDDKPSGDLEFDQPTFRADPRLDAAIEAVWPRLTAAEVVDGVLADPPPALARLCGTAATPPLLDEAAELVDGPPAEVYGHVVVDEAQELTEMDWRAVMRRCPSRSMTVVGDFAQAGPGSTVRTWRQALEPYVGDRFEVHTLTVNYRTTAEILESTRELLAAIAPEQELSRSLRHGPPPAIRTGPVGELRPGTVVICADEIAPDLAEVGAQVIPVSAARGLEFDEVLVVDAYGMGRRDLYVAMTRATHRLTVLRTPQPLGQEGAQE